MTVDLFAIWDSVSEVYDRIWQATNAGTAVRAFIQIVNEPSSDFYKSPGDYTLFHVGTFDKKTGVVEKLMTPVSLGVAIQFIAEGPALQTDAFNEDVSNA